MAVVAVLCAAACESTVAESGEVDAAPPSSDGDSGPRGPGPGTLPGATADARSTPAAPSGGSDAGVAPVSDAPPVPAAAADAGTGDSAGGGADGDAEQRGPASSRTVFATSVLHEIAITLEPEGYARIFTDKVECDPLRRDQRFTADVSFDGVVLTRVGARRKGNWGSINRERPAFSLKFDWDPQRPQQRLFGLDRLTLNNAIQDRGFVSEHMAYEVARRAGIAAPLTSHAVVRVNGVVRGIYVVKESIDGDFLERNYGKASSDGNLYEGEWLRDECGGIKPEFLRAAEDPRVMKAMDLKNEVEDMRTRADLLAAIDAARKTSATTQGGEPWIAAVEKHIDLDQFISFFAVEALTNHHDGYTVLGNNYFMYRRPDTNRFQFIHHGADRAFETSEAIDPLAPRTSEAPNLARFVLQIPRLNQRYKAELTRIVRQPWDVDALLARMAEVARVLSPLKARTEVVLGADVRRFEATRPTVERVIRERKALMPK